MTTEELVEAFERIVATAIDERGIYPYPCLWIARDDKLHLGALDLTPGQAMTQAWKLIVIDGAKELIIGLDRETRPGQGTEFADVLTCAHWTQEELRIGVINYQHEPRIVRPIDWNNAFWARRFADELRAAFPPFRIAIQ